MSRCHMKLVKIQFFCGLGWKWEVMWLSFEHTPTEDQLMKMLHYTHGGDYAPQKYSHISREVFSILREVELRDGRQIYLGD